MISLIRLVLRLTWLVLFVLGIGRAMEILQGGANDLIDRIEEGETGSAERMFARLHEALHHRQIQHPGVDDPSGEM